MQPDHRPSSEDSISSQPTALASRANPPAVAPPATPDTSRTLSSQDTAGGAGSPSSSGAPLLDIERKVFAERFDLLEELGSGGMGRVLKAFDRKLQRAVAVKRIKGPLATDPDLLRRFLREAQFAARLNHPNVVTVHDILTDDEGPYLVLEFIDGESLAQRLQRGGAIPWREAIDLLLPICDAVTAAHAQGIIHRDIKPANILLPKKGSPKLADFGIARPLEGAELTMTGAILGSIDYMAPEQMDGAKSVDERTDIYSLAATLYHMLTGEPPRPITSEELPRELRSATLKGMSRDPRKRQRCSADFASEIRDTIANTSSKPQRTNTIPVGVSASDVDVDDSCSEKELHNLRKRLFSEPYNEKLRRRYLSSRTPAGYRADLADTVVTFWDVLPRAVMTGLLAYIIPVCVLISIANWLFGADILENDTAGMVFGGFFWVVVIGYGIWVHDNMREKKAREIGPLPEELRNKPVEVLQRDIWGT